MFSGLSKLADKPFILGYFLPALIGLAAFTLANQDIGVFAQWYASAQQGDKGLGDVVALLLIIWFVSIALMGMNDLTYRFLEGYFWPLNREHFKERQRQRFRSKMAVLAKEKKALQEASDVLNQVKGLAASLALADAEKEQYVSVLALAQAQFDEILRSSSNLYERLVREFVSDERHILGTRLGNVIRCFEMYPSHIYGVSSIVTWPRLLDVVAKDYRDILSDARAAVDMFVSLILVSVIVGITAAGRLIYHLSLDDWPALLPRFIYTGIAAFVGARVFYLLAIHSAAVWWGEVYRGAYDLYLGALAEKLGCEAPFDPTERQTFWKMVSRQYRYHAQLNFSKYKKSAPQKDPERPEKPPAASSGEDAGTEE